MHRTISSKRGTVVILTTLLSLILYLQLQSDRYLFNFFFNKFDHSELEFSTKITYPRAAYFPRKDNGSGWLEIDFISARKRTARFDTGNMLLISEERIYGLTQEANTSKYFVESEKFSDHADVCFATDDRILDVQYKYKKLNLLQKALIEFTNANNLTTWISHGMSLLEW
jgi:hypothetical protein